MKRVVYHVVWRGERWHVRRARARRSTRTFGRKGDATFAAVFLCTKHDRSEVIIHRKDGAIQREWTYGDDPRTTPG
jgi:hypothetical protein